MNGALFKIAGIRVTPLGLALAAVAAWLVFRPKSTAADEVMSTPIPEASISIEPVGPNLGRWR